MPSHSSSQGDFNLVLVLIALTIPRRWPGRREERAILLAIGLAFGVRSLARLIESAPEIIASQLALSEKTVES